TASWCCPAARWCPMARRFKPAVRVAGAERSDAPDYPQGPGFHSVQPRPHGELTNYPRGGLHCCSRSPRSGWIAMKPTLLSLALVGVAAALALAGQPAAPHWAFQPVKRPHVPRVKNAAWVHNPIDAFIAAAHEAKGLTPAPEAPRRTLIRRLSFDLIGLP